MERIKIGVLTETVCPFPSYRDQAIDSISRDPEYKKVICVPLLEAAQAVIMLVDGEIQGLVVGGEANRAVAREIVARMNSSAGKEVLSSSLFLGRETDPHSLIEGIQIIANELLEIHSISFLTSAT